MEPLSYSNAGFDSEDTINSGKNLPINGFHMEPIGEAEVAETNLKNGFTKIRNGSTRPAVEVRNAFKSYGKSTHVLKNFQMTVKEGTIYSLLGSSGCGKTTILSAIVGIKSLDSGEIRVFGETPGTEASGIPGKAVGHMPQEYSLHQEFTVQESFIYYGYIYGMSRSKIKERSEFLLKFLELPKPSRRVATLSGGQKRRVSLALSMLHEPKLLILDEPTVGVDHLLRERIWTQLTNLISNGKTTVIITTHYVEEARNSDTVGVMRNGRLLTEKSPENLLKAHKATLLEDVVLNLSRMDSGEGLDYDDTFEVSQTCSSIVEIPSQRASFKSENKESKISTKKQSFKSPVSFSRFQALVIKNLILLVRNYIFLIFNFFSPSLQIIVCCLAIGNDPKGLKFGVVNHEVLNSCDAALKSTNMNITTEECTPQFWSCKFIDSLPKDGTLELVSYTNEDEAYAAVQRGENWGYMGFPENFSSNLYERFVGGVYPTNESIEGSSINFRLDMSSETIGRSMQRNIILSFQKFTARILEDCGFDSRVGGLPLHFDEPVYGTMNTSFREFLAPSILLGLLFFVPLCSAGISYISDKKAGTLERSLIAGVTTVEVMLANLVTQILVLFGQAGFAFFIMTFVFGITVHGSLFSAIFLTMLIGVAGMSMGFLISTFVVEEIHAVLLSMGCFFPNFLLAGMVWPLEGMPLYLQYIGYLLPCTLACESMRSIVSRGWGIFHYRVWPGFASTLAWITIYWITTILIHKLLSKRR